MLSLSSKKCILYTQIRQFVTFHTRSRASVKERPLNYCVESKYSNVTSPVLNVHRLFNTNHSEEESDCIKPLMQLPDAFPTLSPSLLASYCYVRLKVDKDFRLSDFYQGAVQAITFTMDALSTQNYEMLEGIVKERPLKVLKHRVSRLTSAQRRLLGSERIGILYIPSNITVRSNKENEYRVKVKVCGCFYAQDVTLSTIFKDTLIFCYTFERKYINNIGQSWMIKIANHFSLNGV